MHMTKNTAASTPAPSGPSLFVSNTLPPVSSFLRDVVSTTLELVVIVVERRDIRFEALSCPDLDRKLVDLAALLRGIT
jgi:hypothetical protein